MNCLFQKGKYISREFQELCAQLALGRVSKTSSAPCDTRLALRPSSGSAIRRDTPVQTNLSARPRTAPLRSPHLQNHDLESVLSKPDVNTEAFSEKNTNRPKTVVLHDRHERTLIREGTEIVLPNALTPEDVIDAKLPKQRKAKEHAPLSVTHQVRKPPERMSREKTFLKSPRRKIVKPSKQFENHLGQDIIDSVEECSDSDDKEAEDEKLKQNTEQKTSDKKSASSVKTEDSKHIKPAEMEETIGVDKPVKRGTANAGNKSSGLSTGPNRVKQEQQKYGSVKSAGSYNSKDTVSKPSTKEAAFSILQKLTGKRQQDVHKPGQVPSVSKQRRKYKFAPPRNDADIQKLPEKQNLENQETVTRTDKESKNSELQGEKGNKTTGKPVEIRKEMMKKQSMLPGKQGRFESEESVEVDKRKPVSAPVRNRKPGAGTSGKYPVYETKDTVCKPKQVSVRESQSAQPRIKQGKSFKIPEGSMKITSDEDKSKQLLNTQSQMKIDISKSEGGDLNWPGAAARRDEQNSKTFRNMFEKDPVPSAATDVQIVQQKKGVRIQNAMISTSIDVSESKFDTENEPDGGRVSAARSNTPANLHPKYEDSPYLRENPLLQSGKQRRRPRASSAQSSEQGASGVSSVTKSMEQRQCNCDFSYNQSVIYLKPFFF